MFDFHRSLVIAKEKGLKLPIVYNTGGYDSPETLALLDGIVDIYMPDMKYGDKKLGRKYSKIDNYPQVNQAGVKEMHRQVWYILYIIIKMPNQLKKWTVLHSQDIISQAYSSIL